MSDSNAGANAGTQNAENSDDKPLTKSELMALLGGFREEFNKSLTSAITGHTKRLKDQLTKDVEGRLAAIKQPSRGEETEEGEGEAQTTDTGGQTTSAARAEQQQRSSTTQQAPKPDPEVAKLRRELEKLKSEYTKAEQKVAEESRKRIQTEGYQAIKNSLSGKVVQGAETTVLDLLRGRNAVQFTEDGTVRIKLGLRDEPEDGHDLDDGIKAFMGLPESKFFAPPPGSGGNNGARKSAASTTTSVSRPATTGTQNPDAIASVFEESTGKSLADSL